MGGTPEMEEDCDMNSCDAEPRRQVSDFAFLPFPRSLSSQTFSQSLLGPDGGARLEALNLAGCMEEFRSPPGLPEVCASAPGRLAVRPDDAPCFPLKGTPEMEEDCDMNSCDTEPRRQVSDLAFLPLPRSLSAQTLSQSLLGPDGGARLEALNLAGCVEQFRSPPGLAQVSAPGRLAVRPDNGPCVPLKGTPEVYASAPRRLAKQSFGRPDGNTPCIPLNGAPETEEAPVDMKWPSFQQPQAPVIQQSQLAQPLTIQPLVMQPPVMQIPFIQQPFIGNDVQPFGDRIQQGGDVQLGEEDCVNSGPKEIFIPKQSDDALSKFLNKFCR